MLLYHFDGKDDLVATVLRVSNDRSVAEIRARLPPPDVRGAVPASGQAVTSTAAGPLPAVYVEAAALGLFGREPYVTVVREANALWVAAMRRPSRGAGDARAPRPAAPWRCSTRP